MSQVNSLLGNIPALIAQPQRPRAGGGNATALLVQLLASKEANKQRELDRLSKEVLANRQLQESAAGRQSQEQLSREKIASQEGISAANIDSAERLAKDNERAKLFAAAIDSGNIALIEAFSDGTLDPSIFSGTTTNIPATSESSDQIGALLAEYQNSFGKRRQELAQQIGILQRQQGNIEEQNRFETNRQDRLEAEQRRDTKDLEAEQRSIERQRAAEDRRSVKDAEDLLTKVFADTNIDDVKSFQEADAVLSGVEDFENKISPRLLNKFNTRKERLATTFRDKTKNFKFEGSTRAEKINDVQRLIEQGQAVGADPETIDKFREARIKDLTENIFDRGAFEGYRSLNQQDNPSRIVNNLKLINSILPEGEALVPKIRQHVSKDTGNIIDSYVTGYQRYPADQAQFLYDSILQGDPAADLIDEVLQGDFSGR